MRFEEIFVCFIGKILFDLFSLFSQNTTEFSTKSTRLFVVFSTFSTFSEFFFSHINSLNINLLMDPLGNGIKLKETS
jgi:hypothetical protein